MTLDFSHILSFLEKIASRAFFPAVFLTGLVLIVSPDGGWFKTDSREINWLPALVLFSGVFSLLQGLFWLIEQLIKDVRSGRLSRIIARREVVKKLLALLPQRREHLGYIKLKGLDQFQAFRQDEVLTSLSDMGLIEQLEWTLGHNALYTVPKAVWCKLPTPNETEASYLSVAYKDSPPWDPDRHSDRIDRKRVSIRSPYV